MANKLELTWYGKDEPIRVEPRLLIENAALSNTKRTAISPSKKSHKCCLTAVSSARPITT